MRGRRGFHRRLRGLGAPDHEHRQAAEDDDQPDQQQPEPSEDGQDGANPEELTKEQQEQILKALDRDEEELKRSVQKRLKGGKPKSGKKW